MAGRRWGKRSKGKEKIGAAKARRGYAQQRQSPAEKSAEKAMKST
jgi:hypothetical protein